VCSCITSSSFFTVCSPCASHLSVDEPYILSILKSFSFPPSPGPLTSIQMFSTSSYQTVLSRVVLQSSPDSSVHIATPLGAGRSGVRFPAKARDFFPSTKRSRSAPRPTQTHSVGTWNFPAEGKGTWQCSCPLNLNVNEYSCVTCSETWFVCFMCAVDLVLTYSSRCSDTLIVANL